MVGFTGSRRPSGAQVAAAQRAALIIAGYGIPVAVGCASGIDAAVRNVVPGAEVFRVEGSGPGAFALRSVAMVKACKESRGWVALAAYPSAPCPARLVPSGSSSACFNGSGSGTWATAAYAVGIGVPIVVFGQVELPEWGGKWEPVRLGPLVGGWRFVSNQLSFI
ncbi:MAG: hypothetical protein HGB00_08350 [Chlorobiaceae bacterium]|nr:hypothetical protein [Chlorobiaceae bacterium]